MTGSTTPPLKHPAPTALGRRILDAIGAGQPRPPMLPATRKAMADAGLIFEIAPERITTDGLTVTLRQWEMPVLVRQAWCAFQAQECARMQADDGGPDV